MRHCNRFTLAALVVICSINVAHAVPQLINYQGILTDGGGTPITIVTNVEFRIWDSNAGGTVLWMETQIVAPDSEGRFKVTLGSVNPIPNSALADAEAHLGVTIPPDGEMMPRSQLVAAAYAFRVGSIEGAAAGALDGSLVLKPNSKSIRDALAWDAPNIILVSTPGDSIQIGPPDSVAVRAVSATGDEWLLIAQEPLTGGSLRIRDPGGSVAVLSAASADFVNSSGDVVATIGEEGIQVLSSSSKNGSRTVDTVFSFNPATHSLRIGLNNTVGGFNSIAVGTGNSALGVNSIAIGTNNEANWPNCVAMGNNNVADSNEATITGGRNNVADNLGTTIGGGLFNTASGDAATVAGGFGNSALVSNSTVGGGIDNTASHSGSTVAGGGGNTASGANTTIAGGESNNVVGWWSSIAGGLSNYVGLGGSRCVIGGGLQDSIFGGEQSVIGGGYLNRLDAFQAVIGGGQENSSVGWWSTIPGGRNNETGDQYAFAAGRRAKATHAGSFVWGDTTDSDVSSSAVNEFTVRATGGARFFTNTGLTTGVTISAGGGSWTSVSDSTLKRNIRPVDGADILARLNELSISRWSYESQSQGIEHIGPMAQDFYRLFGVGDNDKTITTVDPDGIALAAIKELSARNAKLEERVSELTELVARLVNEK